MMKKSQYYRLGALLVFASVMILLGMMFGGISRVSGNITGMELYHQLAVVVGGSVLVVSCLVLFKKIKQIKVLWVLLSIGIAALALQVVLGQILLASGASDNLAGVHFLLSVIVLGAVSASAGYVFLTADRENYPEVKLVSRFSKRMFLLVLLVMVVLVSGVWLSNSGSRWACAEWPFCGGGFLPSGEEWVSYLHRGFVAVVGVVLVGMASAAWKRQRSQRFILTMANSLAILYAGQGFIGAISVLGKSTWTLVVLHELTAGVIVVVGSLLVVALGVYQRTEAEEEADAALVVDRGQRLRDFITLNKPIVVMLLLATTLAGMVMGYQGWPPTGIVLVTMISGALAAGGSGAVNQFIDRDVDVVMARTAKRPIPAGRLTPAEGLAFGVSALIVSFYLMAGLVNILAALLTLAGMVYYVFLYSVVLKRRSVQNIVIGGGAGAIPPLVGWAAATGSLNLTAGFLFLIIFFWTPPHFWALALTRHNEYASAGVPMMPAVRGEAFTRKLIFQYTVVLVVLTILMWFLGLAGWLFLTSALLLGGYLLWLAWQVWRNGRNRIYYQMYRHSNYYLLLLFAILAVDSVVL